MISTEEALRGLAEPIRPLKRIEYERLAALGFFEDERLELLFGVVVPRLPRSPAHAHSSTLLRTALQRRLHDRAFVHGRSFAASDISEPEPDILVFPNGDYWKENPKRAFLVAEISSVSLTRNKGPKLALYALADVDEYWIVNHVDDVVEVYRDRHNGEWRQRTTHRRGETIAMVAFPDVTIVVSEILPPVNLER